MITEHSIEAVRARIRQWRSDGAVIGFVATMGNLHEGHLSLVRAVHPQVDKVVASVFVNPLQFGPHEDYDDYPRTLDADKESLQSLGCDLLFAPGTKEMYPDGNIVTRVSVGELGSVLCGAHRIGHFDGMATVVTKLLMIVQPDIAVFGRKDYQQLVVIRRLVRDLNLPVEIQGVETTREPDGLAMSSRNAYLSPEQRETAPLLYSTLTEVSEKIVKGDRGYQEICATALQKLVDSGFRPDYVEVRNAEDLSEPDGTTNSLVILAAAALGRTRLIDNVQVDLSPAAD